MSQGVTDRLHVEWTRFRAALPSLERTHYAGRWVVFKDGRVRAEADNEDAALTRGLQLFGLSGAQVVARVEQPQLRRVSPIAGWVL